MNYNGNIYRPPIEAHTMLIPVTEGCTHNKCTFCNMYQNVPFRMWSLDEVEDYLAEIKDRYGRLADSIDRVYLVGADPFALSAKKLLTRISLIKKYLPNVTVITMYARTDNIAHKTDEDLKQLKEAGVNDLYIGVESGDDVVLKRINKGYTAAQAREVLEKIDALGLPYIVNFLNGAGGHEYGLENAHRTAQLYDGLHMTMVNISMLTIVPGTPLYSHPTSKFDSK